MYMNVYICIYMSIYPSPRYWFVCQLVCVCVCVCVGVCLHMYIHIRIIGENNFCRERTFTPSQKPRTLTKWLVSALARAWSAAPTKKKKRTLTTWLVSALAIAWSAAPEIPISAKSVHYYTYYYRNDKARSCHTSSDAFCKVSALLYFLGKRYQL